MTTVLVIDDELQIRRLLRLFLEKNQFDVYEASSAEEGLRQFAGVKPDIVLLDLGLPDMDGREVLKSIRERGEAPVIVVSVHDAEAEIMDLLDAGADDYLTKPFGTGELLSRIKVALRHRSPKSLVDGKIQVGSLEVNVETREAFRDGVEERMTPTEWSLLLVFIRNAGKIMTRKHILREVWGPAMEEEYNNLRVYVNQLRKKLETDPGKPRVLVTEPGVGYRLKVLQ